jgi:hypothetical protein
MHKVKVCRNHTALKVARIVNRVIRKIEAGILQKGVKLTSINKFDPHNFVFLTLSKRLINI